MIMRAVTVDRAVRLPLGCPDVDGMLDGGVETGCLTLLYGEAGTGKTTWCLILARDVARSGRKVLYIDTEGVSLGRLKQLAPDDFESVSRNILISAVSGFDDQERAVEKAIKLARSDVGIGMIIVDSVSMHYRLTRLEEERGDRRSLAGQTSKLAAAAMELNLPVIVTTQVYADVDAGGVAPLGGHALMHNAKAIIRLERGRDGARKAVVVKHRELPEGLEADYRLTREGLGCQVARSPTA